MKRFVQLTVFLLIAMGFVMPSLAADTPPVIVGRITDVEEDLLRYVPEENDWEAVIRDVPFAEGDTFYSGNQARAELLAPNGSSVRIGSTTQIQFIALDPEFVEMDVAAGLARIHNSGPNTVIKTDSPFGYVLSYPGSAFDFYVGENSVEVVAVSGKVSFVHTGTNARYDVFARSPSILADRSRVSSGDGMIDPDWDAWNIAHDRFWAARGSLRGTSARYLPSSLRRDAYALEENGRWMSVSYEGRKRWFWRPTRVAAGWAPFTVGCWTEWHGDQTWIPAEPFGYVTHHYGAWVLVGNQWYWAPPVAGPGQPLLDVGFAWYPGRVSWICDGGHVGWVPLAPRETYYSHYAWRSPRTVVVTNINIGRISIAMRNLTYARHAVVVRQNDFRGVNSYRNVRVTNININSYHAAPVVNDRVVNNYHGMGRKYSYANVTVNEKPHASVVNRIQQNERIVHEGRKENPAAIGRQMNNIRQGNINREARVPQPQMTNRMVPASQMNRSAPESMFQRRDGRTVGQGAGARTGVQGQPGPAPANTPGSRQPQGVQRPGEAGPSGSQQRGDFGPQRAGQPSQRPQFGGQAAPAQPSPGPQAVTPAAPAQQMGQPTSRPQPRGAVPTRPGQGAPPGTVQPGPAPSNPGSQTANTPGSRQPQGVQRPGEAGPSGSQQRGDFGPQRAGQPSQRPQFGGQAAPAQQAAQPSPKPQSVAPAAPTQRVAQPSPKPQAAAPATPTQQAAQPAPKPQPQGMGPARPGPGAPSSPPKRPAQGSEAKQSDAEKKAEDAKQKGEQQQPR